MGERNPLVGFVRAKNYDLNLHEVFVPNAVYEKAYIKVCPVERATTHMEVKFTYGRK